MRMFLQLLLCGALCGLLSSPQAAPSPVPAPPSFKSHSYILMDYHSNAILAAKNKDKPVEPASITKLMTAYVVYDAIKQGEVSLDDKVRISEKAWRLGGSKMFVEVGDRVKLEKLLKGMIIQSGNDASLALAQHVAGSEQSFVALMNHEASRLGMTNTHFNNPTGLPHAEHYTTAHDIAKLVQAVIRDFPREYQRYAEKKFTYNGITQYNRNKLLWRDDSVDGLKTGHTQSAGYCLASSAKRDDMRLIAVVMGTTSSKARVVHSQALLNYGFRFYETHKLYTAGQSLTKLRIWDGEQEHTALGLLQPLYVTIPHGRYDALQASMDVDADTMAPIARGQPLGSVTVALDGETLKAQSLVALKPVPLGGLVRRVTDTVLQWFQ